MKHESIPAAMPTEFDRLERAWLYAGAQWQLAENDPARPDGLDNDESQAFCQAEMEAYGEMMLHPVTDPRHLARKLEAYRKEEAWELVRGEQILDRLIRDASLIAYGHED